MGKNTVYFLVVLTTISLGLSLVPTAFSQPEKVKIVSYSSYFDTAGFFDIVGEIQNIGPNTINQVTISGAVTTSDGTQTPSYGKAWVQYLAPQQKAPFEMSFYLQSANGQGSQTTTVLPDVVNIELSVVQADTTNYHQYPDLTITTQSHSIDATTDNKGTYWVSGTIKNTGSQTATNLRILGTFYNSSGAVIAVGGYTTEVLTASLAPSSTADFKFGAYDINQTGITSSKKIESYSLLLQAEGPVPTGAAPQITPYPTGNSSPSDTTSPTITESPDSGNGSSSDLTGQPLPEWSYAVVAAIVLAAIVVTVVALKRRKPDEEPKTTGKNASKKNALKKTAPKRTT